ncbi:hypothetical protein EYF80_053236 [Liparis tanakae]|uniref:Uncharacterized protein n=1 Tax=Liparis tanakae TaxID=230148 RepID=A0A4Z2F8G9_9TELE|nr:hypothetical protein EYF80_053236 [Liparis tanakae]
MATGYELASLEEFEELQKTVLPLSRPPESGLFREHKSVVVYFEKRRKSSCSQWRSSYLGQLRCKVPPISQMREKNPMDNTGSTSAESSLFSGALSLKELGGNITADGFIAGIVKKMKGIDF